MVPSTEIVGFSKATVRYQEMTFPDGGLGALSAALELHVQDRDPNQRRRL